MHSSGCVIVQLVDDLWVECCKHGEVERISPLLDGNALNSSDGAAAVRFQSVIAAAAAVDALDGRFFAERALVASFDDGRAAAALPSGDGESFCEDDDNSPASVDTFEPKLDVLPSGDGDDDDIVARLCAGTVLSLGGMATGGPPCRRRVTLRRGHLEWSAPLETENGEGGAISLVAVEAVVAVGGRKHRLRVRSATSQGADDLFVDCDSREDVPALRDGLEREASQARNMARAVVEKQLARVRARLSNAFEQLKCSK